MKKLLIQIAVTFFTTSLFFAQAAIVGCDGDGCTWPKIYETLRSLISLGLAFCIMYGAFRVFVLGVKYGWKQYSPEVRKEFSNNVLVILISALALISLIPISSYVLKKLNTLPAVQEKLDCLSHPGPGCEKAEIFHSPTFFAHANAQSLLPVTVDIGAGIYEFSLSVFQIIVQILFVVLIIIWIYGGFSLVAARGEPAELAKAKGRLWFTFYITVILMLVQALLLSLGSALGATITK